MDRVTSPTRSLDTQKTETKTKNEQKKGLEGRKELRESKSEDGRKKSNKAKTEGLEGKSPGVIEHDGSSLIDMCNSKTVANSW